MASNVAFEKGGYKFLNTEANVENGIAVQPYGAIIFPKAFLEGDTTVITLKLQVNGGVTYDNTMDLASVEIGDTIAFAPAQ